MPGGGMIRVDVFSFVRGGTMLSEGRDRARWDDGDPSGNEGGGRRDDQEENGNVHAVGVETKNEHEAA